MIQLWQIATFMDNVLEAYMATSSRSGEARLNFRLAPELKDVIEQAAAQRGQTVSDFAVSTLVDAARGVLREEQITTLSKRDAEIFVQLLDDRSMRPNKALQSAARKYKRKRG
jgi:uncharacterized protein (DUF1778 family)